MSTKRIKRIVVAEDFSRVPAGRFLRDGPGNGQRFREDFLVPALRRFDEVIIYLDGTEGYGSSFLDEAFAGLITRGLISKQDLLAKLRIETEDPSFADFKRDIFEYIEAAKPAADVVS